MTLKLSKSARALINEPGFGSYYRFGSADDIAIAAEEALNRPSGSIWYDDRMYVTHTLMFAYSPLADDIIGESNYRTILTALQAEFPGSDRVDTGGFGHWTYAHFDAILIRVLDKRGRITPEFCRAAEIAHALSDYPIFDESDYSSLEMEYWDKSFDDEFEWITRDVEVSDDDRARIAQWVVESWYGWSDPGYVDPEWIREAASELGIAIEEVEED